MTVQEQLIQWLQEAHALEEKLITTLGKQASDVQDDFPQLAARLRQHQEESEKHRDLVKLCLAQFDTEPAGLKDLTGKLGATLEGVMAELAEDKVIKYQAMAYGVEHFEIATYHTILTAAEELEKDGIVSMCQQILADEEEMANWLEDYSQEMTLQYLESLKDDSA